jgi:hypothetical protein
MHAFCFQLGQEHPQWKMLQRPSLREQLKRTQHCDRSGRLDTAFENRVVLED